MSHPAHASIITVAGHKIPVRRSFALICRIEERFGPLKDFGERLETCTLTARELFDLYKCLFADFASAPPDEMIEGHVAAAGMVAMVSDLHPLVSAFFFGEERFMKRVAEQAGSARPTAIPDQGPGPAIQAGSNGANSSGPHPGSAGVRPISGAQPSTN